MIETELITKIEMITMVIIITLTMHMQTITSMEHSRICMQPLH